MRAPGVRTLMALVVCALVAVTVLVWAKGGFEGGGRKHPFTVGEVVDLGPVEVQVTGATAKRDYEKNWQVIVTGTCRVTDDEGPNIAVLGDGLFGILTHDRPRRVADRVVVGFGDGGFGMKRDYLSPGLEPLPCTFAGRLPGNFDPSKGITFALSELDFGDDSVTGDQDEHWHPGRNTHHVELDVTVVKE